MQITIFSTTTCPYCKMLKDYLTGKNIPFIEKIVDLDEEAKKEMESVSGGFLGVPFIVIDLGEGKKETVIGFDKGKIDELINNSYIK